MTIVTLVIEFSQPSGYSFAISIDGTEIRRLTFRVPLDPARPAQLRQQPNRQRDLTGSWRG